MSPKGTEVNGGPLLSSCNCLQFCLLGNAQIGLKIPGPERGVTVRVRPRAPNASRILRPRSGFRLRAPASRPLRLTPAKRINLRLPIFDWRLRSGFLVVIGISYVGEIRVYRREPGAKEEFSLDGDGRFGRFGIRAAL